MYFFALSIPRHMECIVRVYLFINGICNFDGLILKGFKALEQYY